MSEMNERPNESSERNKDEEKLKIIIPLNLRKARPDNLKRKVT